MTSEDRDRTLRILTLVLTAIWTGTLVVRLHKPEWAIGTAVDALMVTVCGYWFSREGLKKDKDK